jgi:hypothetical protein
VAPGGYSNPAYPGYPTGAPTGPPLYASTPYPQAGYPQAGYPQAGYPQAGYPMAGYPQAGYPGYPGYPPNGYAAWYAQQGALFPSTLFSTNGGQASMASGGYPYKGYPPGAVPPPTSGYSYGAPGYGSPAYGSPAYGAPRVASAPLGVSSNAPNFVGRNSLPFGTGGY